MPKQLHQIALSATKAEDFATMRIAPKTLRNRQRKGIHSPRREKPLATPHIRHPARNPHLRARRKRDHCPSTTGNLHLRGP